MQIKMAMTQGRKITDNSISLLFVFDDFDEELYAAFTNVRV